MKATNGHSAFGARRHLRLVGCLIALLAISAMTMPSIASAAKKVGPPRVLIGLGDSLAFGYSTQSFNENLPTEPIAGFEKGYVSDYYAEVTKPIETSLVNYGCPGETTGSMIGNMAEAEKLTSSLKKAKLINTKAGDKVTFEAPCAYHETIHKGKKVGEPPEFQFPLHNEYGAAGTSQLEAAVAKIKQATAEGRKVKIITLNIGANDQLHAVAVIQKEAEAFIMHHVEQITKPEVEGVVGAKLKAIVEALLEPEVLEKSNAFFTATEVFTKLVGSNAFKYLVEEGHALELKQTPAEEKAEGEAQVTWGTEYAKKEITKRQLAEKIDAQGLAKKATVEAKVGGYFVKLVQAEVGKKLVEGQIGACIATEIGKGASLEEAEGKCFAKLAEFEANAKKTIETAIATRLGEAVFNIGGKLGAKWYAEHPGATPKEIEEATNELVALFLSNHPSFGEASEAGVTACVTEQIGKGKSFAEALALCEAKAEAAAIKSLLVGSAEEYVLTGTHESELKEKGFYKLEEYLGLNTTKHVEPLSLLVTWETELKAEEKTLEEKLSKKEISEAEFKEKVAEAKAKFAEKVAANIAAQGPQPPTVLEEEEFTIGTGIALAYAAAHKAQLEAETVAIVSAGVKKAAPALFHQIEINLKGIVLALRTAAPKAKIKFLGGYDPYGRLTGPTELLPGSNELTEQLNLEETGILKSKALKGCLANPHAAFNPGTFPAEAGTLATLTNMANLTETEIEPKVKLKNGPDIHPTAAGYKVLAETIKKECP
ncbi:MAG TPA: hypothetical protein VMI13_05115 [Solirubrobacteraceae bacterium]|nr:hypothetical protein [Solirubrobacteraceae bacterium]